MIVGLGGNDVIAGLGGNDLMCGGPGSDKLDGGAGSDRLSGDRGNDVLVGGVGSDTADFSSSSAGIDADLAAGTATGAGADTLRTIENLVGCAGDDFFVGDSGNNSLSGGNGFDVLVGLGGNDRLDGGRAFDLADFETSVTGVMANLSTRTATGEGTDTLTNIEGVIGSPLDDTLTGSSGVNLFIPLTGNDVVEGGDGVDFVDFEASSAPITANLSTGTATGEGTDTLTHIEGLIGSPGNDSLTGDGGPKTLLGLAGDDTLDGGAGTDALDGGDGTDPCLNGENNSNCEL